MNWLRKGGKSMNWLQSDEERERYEEWADKQVDEAWLKQKDEEDETA